MTIAQHSSITNEHYTPLDIVDLARKTMGGIDLDPATTEAVNRDRIKANVYYTQETNGLDHPWFGKVWLNPPGGRIGNKSSAAVWWSALAKEWDFGRTEQAIFLGFTLEIFATSQDSDLWIGDDMFAFCIPRHRIEFDKDVDGVYTPGGSPAHSNVIVYLPPIHRREDHLKRFRRNFEKLGAVRIS